jgi:alpha-beta hydrolase superfamily lysophospholipase
MLQRNWWFAISAWLGLLTALLSLVAYRLTFGAVGVILDTRPAGLAFAGFSLVLTILGLRHWRGIHLFAVRRIVGSAALLLALPTAGLLLKDLFLAYHAYNVRFSSGNISLVGTLYLPRTGSPPWPAVVITHGAGEQTRDEGTYYARLFARNGIAGLAYDKRGSGDSEGDVEIATYQDLAIDALAAVDYLANHAKIDGERIGLWGVSEGGWVIPIAAADRPKIAFVIAVSATAETPAQQTKSEVQARVRRAGYSQEIATRAAELYGQVSEFERSGQGYADLAAALQLASRETWFGAAGYLPEKLLTFAELKQLTWYTTWRTNMDFDAPTFWQRVRCPVLVLLGGSDPKMESVRASTTIRDALAAGGNTDVTIQIFPNAEHGLVEWWLPGRMPPPRFPDGYPTLMVDWIRQRVGRSQTITGQP